MRLATGIGLDNEVKGGREGADWEREWQREMMKRWWKTYWPWSSLGLGSDLLLDDNGGGGSLLRLGCRCLLTEFVWSLNLNKVAVFDSLLDGLDECWLVDLNIVLSLELLGDGLHGGAGTVTNTLDRFVNHNGISWLRNGGCFFGRHDEKSLRWKTEPRE